MPKLLVIDDDRSVLYLIEQAFKDSPISVLSARSVEEGLQLIGQSPDVLLLDIMLPEISGLEAFRKVQALDGKLPVIFITGRTSSDTAIEAIKLGAYDYLCKPLDLPKLRELVDRAMEIRRLMQVPVSLPRSETTPADCEQIVGRSPEMQEVFKAIGRVAPQNVTVLIHGESGTGKELVARAIYHHSDRAEKRFLAVNCAAIPEALLESELFGHEKGSFTSADQRRIGKFEQCNGGTIFLDEVGDMSPLVQSKVLRVLQEQRFERVGGTETIQTDVRIIAATNRDLRQMATCGDFREDLYYRLNGFAIKLPPLRERGDDLLLLLERCVERFGREIGKDVRSISPDALDILTHYSWPGNVRELEAVIRQALLQTTGTVILPEFLPDAVRIPASSRRRESSDGLPAGNLAEFVDHCLETHTTGIYSDAVEMMDRYLVTRVLRHTHGNQSRAARLLGITRGNLRNKIRLLRISLDTTVRAEPDHAEEEEREFASAS
ncbi:MAG: sigma-54-dependent Fis family transcriptional regulator [Planctomycetia bacterium]|nr:sigma-54-dependent Fis family transcriptional regulator [Planctomycetia bacterium]